MTSPCELTAPEREHYEETVRELERRIDEVCAERADLRQMTNEVIDQRDRVQSERDVLADRLAIAERAAREEREARIAAERALYAEMEQDPATVLGRMRAERDAATSRASRYRLRLARVLDLCMRAGFWARRGLRPGHRHIITQSRLVARGVWSGRALSGGKGER